MTDNAEDFFDSAAFRTLPPDQQEHVRKVAREDLGLERILDYGTLLRLHDAVDAAYARQQLETDALTGHVAWMKRARDHLAAQGLPWTTENLARYAAEEEDPDAD